MNDLKRIENKAVLVALGIFSIVWIVIGLAGLMMGQDAHDPKFIRDYCLLWIMVFVIVNSVVVGIVKFSQRGR